MDIKKLFIGTIAGALVFFFVGWLVYGNLIQAFMHQNTGEKGRIDRKEMEYLFLVIGQLLYGLLLTYILLKANVHSIVGGLITGGVVGFLMAAAMDFTTYGTTLVLSKKGLAAEVIAATVISAIAGAVIAAVAGSKKG